MNNKRSILSSIILGGSLLSTHLLAAPILTLNPVGGALAGLAGQTVGWGFTLTNQADFAVINSVTYSASTTLGTFEGIAQNVFRIVGPVSAFSSGPLWTESFDNLLPTGLARFAIDSLAAPGLVS